ncbi:MAG TPA: NAD(P)H-dependent oxidoreductase [Methylomusa anaerophila]|uniref:NADPH-dependent FMN reductase n=1 Tax=Methylomusa anaerophila TaxID=1930071 RepID=A0A348AIJ9_9FIRM|nr:NAD(P)H-dependent oxidoreductase [Methylomusa anaerophila]BBB90897.1 NADPH-dependent FMN reductase [Methylomusa anaerophila]HML90616.1 NAD(P)H-dependent oxidoreductase [Methylomusa anaerophila]
MADVKIAVIVGSLRKDSFNRKIAKALMSLAPAGLVLEEVDIGQLAMYNQDFDDESIPLAEWTAFRETMKQYTGVLFVTPEYNRSVPAVLKNALDVGSRPYGQSIWNGKPAAIVSVSPGGLSAFGANHHLRQSLVFLNVPAMQQPEAYIGNVANLFDAAGEFVNAETKEFLYKFMLAFAEWVNKVERQ